MKFLYDVGYSGLVYIGSTQVLATGGNVSISSQPIYTTGVWGAGWKNASDKIAFAPNYIVLQGSVNFQATPNAMSAVQTFAWSKRYTSNAVQILPNGVAGYSGYALCTGCTFSASQDALITCDISFKCAQFTSTAIKNTSSSSLVSKSSIGVGSANVAGSTYTESVYPFWASQFRLGGFKGGTTTRDTSTTGTSAVGSHIQTTDWSLQYSADVSFVMTCNTITETAYEATGGVSSPKYATIGLMDASGNFTMLQINDNFSYDKIRQVTSCQSRMYTTKHDNGYSLTAANALIQSESIDVQTGNNIVTTQFNVTALGNGSTAPLLFGKLS